MEETILRGFSLFYPFLRGPERSPNPLLPLGQKCTFCTPVRVHGPHMSDTEHRMYTLGILGVPTNGV